MEFVNIAGASRQGWPSVIAETPRARGGRAK